MRTVIVRFRRPHPSAMSCPCTVGLCRLPHELSTVAWCLCKTRLFTTITTICPTVQQTHCTVRHVWHLSICSSHAYICIYLCATSSYSFIVRLLPKDGQLHSPPPLLASCCCSRRWMPLIWFLKAPAVHPGGVVGERLCTI